MQYYFVGQFRPVFLVDIEIYKDKLSQSGDMILSSHITSNSIEWHQTSQLV